MNEMERLTRQAKRIKEAYPPGTRIHLNEMDDRFSPVPSGIRGTVFSVDSIGQIHMRWDNGRTLALVPGVDSFRKLTDKELLEERAAGFGIEPEKISDSARVSVCWDSFGIAVDLNYSYSDAEGYGESVMCFCEPYQDGSPDLSAWEEAQQIGQFLKEKYSLPMDISKNDLHQEVASGSRVLADIIADAEAKTVNPGTNGLGDPEKGKLPAARTGSAR